METMLSPPVRAMPGFPYHPAGHRRSRFPDMSHAPNIIPFPSLPGGNAAAGAVHSSSSLRLMKSDLIEKASKTIPHPPVLINLVSRRVRQLNQGRAPLINPAAYGVRLGQGDIALLEIIEGKITADYGEGNAD